MMPAEFYPPNPPNVPAELTRPTLRYRLQTVLVVASLFLFLALYLTLIVVCAGFSFLAFSTLFDVEYLASFGKAEATLIGTVIVVLGCGTAALTLYFLKGLFKFPKGDSEHLEITEADQPRLFAFIRQICADTGAPAPAAIVVSADVNAGVFYTCTFWGLFFPTKKSLHIGLGLVNSLNLVEFKAVLAHEFGHFSQKSVRLGTYVYTANQIIREIVYGRDWLDDYVTVFGPALAVLRWLLGRLFKIINFAHASLCRQMEFQADLVAVSVTGSDAIVHGLVRSDFGHQCLETTWQDLAAAADHGLRTRDAFHHQTRAADFLRILKDEPTLGIPPPIRGAGATADPVFPPEHTVLPPMWASHPPNHERERNCKRIYIPGPLDDRSAWVLFDNADALRQQVTKHHFEEERRAERHEPPGASERPKPPVCLELQAPEVVQRFIDEDRAETVYSARYHGLYEEGLISPGPIDKLMSLAPSRYEQPACLSAAHADIFGPALRERLDAYRTRREDHERLQRFIHGVETPRGGVFQIRHKEYKLADAPRLVQMLETEIKEDRNHLASLDRRIFLVYMGMARQLQKQTADELEHRYRFHLAVQEMIGCLSYYERQLGQAFQAINSQRNPDPLTIQAMMGALAQSQRALDEQLAAAAHVRLPSLKNMRAGEPLSFFLDAKPTIRGFIGTEQMLNGAWLKQSVDRQADAIDKLRRILYKSLGGLICFQERVGEDWNSQYARPTTRPAVPVRTGSDTPASVQPTQAMASSLR